MNARLRIRPSLLLCALGWHKPGMVTQARGVWLAWCARCRAAVKP